MKQYEYDIQMFVNDGWETVNCELSRIEAIRSIKEYRQNQPGIYRIKKVETRESVIERAKQAIEKRKIVCFDVAANSGQIFDNVKHMAWFVNAIADELEN